MKARTDRALKQFYVMGFDNELYQLERKYTIRNHIMRYAFSRGVNDAILGHDLSAVDDRPWSTTRRMIMNAARRK